MKKIIIAVLASVIILASSCKREKPKDEIAPATGKLDFRVNSYAGDSLFKLDKNFYTVKGDTLSCTKLKFYISNLKLRKKGTNEFVTLSDYYFLMNQAEADEATGRIDMTNHAGNSHISGIPVGEYDQVSFYVGIPQERNHDTTSQTGALDPVNDMYWDTWHEYIFFKFEGKIGSKKDKSFVYHVTGDRNLKTVFIDLKNNTIKVSTDARQKLYLKFFVDKVFSAVSDIDVNTIKNVMGDNANSVKISNNYAQCFAFEKLEVIQ